MVALTNCTFDGHMYNTRRVMEECLAIKPDLVFLWDEAWFGFARFIGCFDHAPRWVRDRSSGVHCRPQVAGRLPRAGAEVGGDIDPSDERLFDVRLIPDPRVAKLRVYQTNSTHKSMSAFRQGSMVLVKDVEFHRHEHSSMRQCLPTRRPSPNQQLIATFDVARRQMELEGYELVIMR